MNWGWPKRSSFTFLPDMITLFNLFTGFVSIVMVAHGRMKTAAWLIVLSLIWDSLDGNIARIFKNPTPFGRELDSLADIVSFVVAPAFLISGFLMHRISPLMLLLLFLYLAAGAYRLARFNIRPPVKDYFEGLPTPAAAITLAMTILACIKNQWTDQILFLFVTPVFLIMLSFLMVSQVRYPKLSAVHFSSWQSFFYLALILFVVIFLLLNAETAIASVFFLFLFLAPVYCLPSRVRPKGEVNFSE